MPQSSPQSETNDLTENKPVNNKGAARKKKKKKKPVPLNPETGLPYSKGTLKMRLLKRLKCTQQYEKQAWAAGAKLVAGVDEVGRGSLFGPVVAAAVILEPGY